MQTNSQRIIEDIQHRLSLTAKRYFSDFYIGTTDDVEQGLFKRHFVKKNEMWWLYRTADTPEEAREVADFFVNKGMRGKKGGDEKSGSIVYCYAVDPFTVE